MKIEKENVLQKQKIIVRYLVSYPLLFALFSFVKTKQIPINCIVEVVWLKSALIYYHYKTMKSMKIQ